MTLYADPIDFASELEERERAAAVTFRYPTPTKRKSCNGPGCANPIKPGTSFCCRECRDAYEREA